MPEVHIDAHLLTLARAKQKVAATAAEIPNFVCSETVERAQIGVQSMKRIRRLMKRTGREQAVTEAPAEFSDTVRLEVGLVDGNEVYSWPGDEFRPVPLSEIVGFGMVETGTFSSFAEALFVGGNGLIHFSGEKVVDGDRMLRFEYEVSLFRSGYMITNKYGKAEVAYKGQFWVRKKDDRLTRLTVEAVDIPPNLNLNSVYTEITYNIVMLDGTSYILPESSICTMENRDGSITRNRTTFSNCRTFQASSDLSFEFVEGDTSAEPSTSGPSTVSLLPGTELEVRLLTEITSSNSKVGDSLEAKVTRPIVADGRVVVGKDAKLLGRLRRIQRVSDEGGPFFAVSLEFTHLETEGIKAPVEARLARLSGDGRLTRTLHAGSHVSTSRYGSAISIAGMAVDNTIVEEQRDRGLEGVDSFYVRGSEFRIRKGLAMTWQIRGKSPKD